MYNPLAYTFASFATFQADPQKFDTLQQNQLSTLTDSVTVNLISALIKDEQRIRILEPLNRYFNFISTSGYSPVKIAAGVTVDHEFTKQNMPSDLQRTRITFESLKQTTCDFPALYNYLNIKSCTSFRDLIKYPTVPSLFTESIPMSLNDFTVVSPDTSILEDQSTPGAFTYPLTKYTTYYELYRRLFSANLNSLFNITADNILHDLNKETLISDLKGLFNNDNFICELFTSYSRQVLLVYQITNTIKTQLCNEFKSILISKLYPLIDDFVNNYLYDLDNLSKLIYDFTSILLQYSSSKLALYTISNNLTQLFNPQTAIAEYNLYSNFLAKETPQALTLYLYLPYYFVNDPIVFLNAIPYAVKYYVLNILYTNANYNILTSADIVDEYNTIDPSAIATAFNATDYDIVPYAKSGASLLINNYFSALIINHFFKYLETTRVEDYSNILISIHNMLYTKGFTDKTFNSDYSINTQKTFHNKIFIHSLQNPGFMSNTATEIINSINTTLDNSSINYNITPTTVQNQINVITQVHSSQVAAFYNSLFISALIKAVSAQVLAEYHN